MTISDIQIISSEIELIGLNVSSYFVDHIDCTYTNLGSSIPCKVSVPNDTVGRKLLLTSYLKYLDFHQNHLILGGYILWSV